MIIDCEQKTNREEIVLAPADCFICNDLDIPIPDDKVLEQLQSMIDSVVKSVTKLEASVRDLSAAVEANKKDIEALKKK